MIAIDTRRYLLFMARDVMRRAIDLIKAKIQGGRSSDEDCTTPARTNHADSAHRFGVTRSTIYKRRSHDSVNDRSHTESPTYLVDTFKSYMTAITELDMSGKRYTDEFKSAAAKQVLEQGRPVREVSGRLGISIDSLYAW